MHYEYSLNYTGVIMLPNHIKVLVVEDDKHLRRHTIALIQELFSEAVVKGAENGVEGLTMFEHAYSVDRNPFQLVVTDHQMDQMVGLRMAHAMHYLDPDCRLILMSGAIFKKEDLAGIDAFVRKDTDRVINLEFHLRRFFDPDFIPRRIPAA
jgi:CheY-like chemotaxis protein